MKIAPCPFPDVLTSLPSWVVWRWMKRGNRMTKVPFDPKTGRMAKSNDPTTWATWDAALRADQRSSYDGIGFVVRWEYEITGVDLDHCIVNGKITPEARLIVDLLHSYTEVTPSGTGLRIYVRGLLPEGGRKSGNVEMYDDLRFFTVTGDHLAGTPETIMERQEALHDLHRRTFPPVVPVPRSTARMDADDATIIARAKDATFSGAKFSALWDGSYKTVNPNWSQSEADLSLCRLLAYWTKNDPSRMDALFRLSALYREKWDEKVRSDETYGERTIRKALH